MLFLWRKVFKRFIPKSLSANSFHQDWKQSFPLGSLSSTYTSLSKLAPVSRKSSKEKIFVPSGKSNSQTDSKKVQETAFASPCLAIFPTLSIGPIHLNTTCLGDRKSSRQDRANCRFLNFLGHAKNGFFYVFYCFYCF